MRIATLFFFVLIWFVFVVSWYIIKQKKGKSANLRNALLLAAVLSAAIFTVNVFASLVSGAAEMIDFVFLHLALFGVFATVFLFMCHARDVK